MMKYLITLFFALFVHLGTAQVIPSQPFFGLSNTQKAQILLPDIVSSIAWETNGNFSPDGKVFLYSTNFMWAGTTIIHMTLNDDSWSEPEIASFSGEYADIDPIFSPDGSRVYFTSRRPIDKNYPNKTDTNLWYVDVLEDGGFGEPKQVSLKINNDKKQAYNSVTREGTIYFHQRDSVSNDIYRAVWNSSEYEVERLDLSINSSNSEADPYISPNEDYLIFTSDRPGGYGDYDLYISFRVNGTWSQPINLGEDVNSIDKDFAPCMNSGILTFTSGRMIEPWNKDAKKDFKTLMSKFMSADNQTDNIWYVHFDPEKYKK